MIDLALAQCVGKESSAVPKAAGSSRVRPRSATSAREEKIQRGGTAPSPVRNPSVPLLHKRLIHEIDRARVDLDIVPDRESRGVRYRSLSPRSSSPPA